MVAAVILGKRSEAWKATSKKEGPSKVSSKGKAAPKVVQEEPPELDNIEPVAVKKGVERFQEAVPEDVEVIITSFVNAQRLVLRTYCLLPTAAPKGLVFACHGYGAHASFEFLLAPKAGEPHTMWESSICGELLAAGFAVCTLDQQGHGHSEGARGLRCFFETFDHLPQENIDFLTQVVLANPRLAGVPVFAMGLSMGGATALRMAQMRPDLFRGAVLYSPMISLEEVKQQRVACCIKNRHFAGVIKKLDAMMSTVPLIAPAKTDALIQKEADEDPFNYKGAARIRTARQFTDLSDRWMVSGGLKDMKVPFITYHSIYDNYTDPLGSAKLMELASTTDKTYRTVGLGQDIDVEMWHRLIAEPGREKIISDTLQWLLERVEAPAAPQGKDADAAPPMVAVKSQHSTRSGPYFRSPSPMVSQLRAPSTAIADVAALRRAPSPSPLAVAATLSQPAEVTTI